MAASGPATRGIKNFLPLGRTQEAGAGSTKTSGSNLGRVGLATIIKRSSTRATGDLPGAGTNAQLSSFARAPDAFGPDSPERRRVRVCLEPSSPAAGWLVHVAGYQ